MMFNDYVRIIPYYCIILQKNVKTIIFSELPQQDKIKYFNFLLENDINFSRDESGNYVALVKVLNPAYYGGGDNNANPSASKVEVGKNKLTTNESKREETKTRVDKKSGASKSLPKNISDNKKYEENKQYNYSNENNNTYKSKKKNTSQISQQFEKDKKVVSYKN